MQLRHSPPESPCGNSDFKAFEATEFCVDMDLLLFSLTVTSKVHCTFRRITRATTYDFCANTRAQFGCGALTRSINRTLTALT
jgi:hypothetical protein